MYQNDKGETDVALEIHLFSGSITKGREQIGMLQQICVQIYISPLELLFQLERVSILIHVYNICHYHEKLKIIIKTTNYAHVFCIVNLNKY